MRQASAIITVATGRQGVEQFPSLRVENYATTQAIDVDADSFSIDIGDPDGFLDLCLDRDNEVRVALFLTDLLGRPNQVFSGIADSCSKGTDKIISIEGRDLPSSLAVDSDAMPGRWRKRTPHAFIAQRAHALGITTVRAAPMSVINHFYTDGSEKEWAFWYRLARMRGMYMWSTNTGALVIDKLAYGLAPIYRFGAPPGGQRSEQWIGVEDAPRTSNKQARLRRVLVYGMKGGSKSKTKGLATPMVAQGVDTMIGSWRKQPVTVLTSTTSKNQAELKKVADDEVFESIVGAQELVLTIRDGNVRIEQNKMALVNLPDWGIESEPWFVVGVQRNGGFDGMTQVVRLREKGFALSKRVPQAPALQNPKDSGENKSASSIGAALAASGQVRWADSFVRAARETGVTNGWDMAVFLGVLLAICNAETGFCNVREGSHGRENEWQPYTQWVNSGDRLTSTKNAQELLIEYEKAFANDPDNIWNPYRSRGSSGDAGVGPMQLTTHSFKTDADKLGWNGVAKDGEYDGGRWNPDSNIREAAKVLLGKLQAHPPANPTDPDTIWIGVERFNSSPAYVAKVKATYKSYLDLAKNAVASAQTIPAGSGVRDFVIPGHGAVHLPDRAPDAVAKAISWAMTRLGDPYEWGGYGPNYDCSSFVTAALASSSPLVRATLDVPDASRHRHGETTYTLFNKGDKVPKDNLLAGDLVFFRGTPPEHVGMYVADGLFIHDPKPGDYVKISSVGEDYYRDGFVGARRYIPWQTRPD